MELNEPLRWLLGRGVALLIGAVVLLVIYRIGVSAIHRFVPAVITAQATHLPSGSSSGDEVAKRIGTIEDLLIKLLRGAVLLGLVALALAVFELWTVLAAIVLLIVAVVFATKDVVLDYVMGFLLLVEGPFFKGDYVVVRDHAGAEGVVEEIGLRRTLLRDALVSSHAVSNGYIPLSSNLTRLFSVAVVELHVPADGRARPSAGDRSQGRGRHAGGRRLGGPVPRGCSDRHLGHRDRHGRRLDQAPAACRDGFPDGRRERTSAAVGRSSCGSLDRDRAVGYPHADREPTSQPTIGERIAGLALRLAIK